MVWLGFVKFTRFFIADWWTVVLFCWEETRSAIVSPLGWVAVAGLYMYFSFPGSTIWHYMFMVLLEGYASQTWISKKTCRRHLAYHYVV